MDYAEADTKQKWTVAARCLNQVGKKLGYSAAMLPLLRCTIHIGNRVAGMHFLNYALYAVCVCSAIWLVQPVNPESQIHAQNGVRGELDPPSVGGEAGMPDCITTNMPPHALYASSLIKRY